MQGMQGRVSVVGGYGGVSRGIFLELLSESSASAVVVVLREAERSCAARLVRAVAGECIVACAYRWRRREKGAHDSSRARIAAFRASKFPFVVRAQDGSRSEHARGRAVSRHFHQLF